MAQQVVAQHCKLSAGRACQPANPPRPCQPAVSIRPVHHQHPTTPHNAATLSPTPL